MEDGPLMLISDPNLTLASAAREVARLLVGLVESSPEVPLPDSPLERTYDYEPGLMEDAYPNLTCQHTGFRKIPGGFEEIRLPRLFTYTLRCYYPILDDDSDVDGLKVAQEMTLDGISYWMEKLYADPPAGYQSLGQRLRFADAPAGRVRGVSEGGLVLYAYEIDVEAYLH